MTTADEQAAQQLAFIEGTNHLADSMTAMKAAMEERGWSTVMSEQIGAQFGAVLMNMIDKPPSPPKGTK